MATESRPKLWQLTRAMSAEDASYASLGQGPQDFSRPWDRELKARPILCGPGFQPLNHYIPFNLARCARLVLIGPSALVLKANRLKGGGLKPGGLSNKRYKRSGNSAYASSTGASRGWALLKAHSIDPHTVIPVLLAFPTFPFGCWRSAAD
jgi:hypothetical protein